LESGKLMLNKQNTSIHDIIVDIITQLKEERKNHNLIMDLLAFNPILNIDTGFISQAFFNILHNSFVYTPEGTTITINTINKNNKIVISISDDGNGLSNESLKHIFDKFYRPPGTKTGGTGLGLSIAKGFIEAHNGTLTVKQNQPHGLIFEIQLPV
jgi:two-component system, OmpR family, sensor histidine kinase KdpD